MSCLPSDAWSHFEQREQELLALDPQLGQQLGKPIAAAREAASSPQGHGAAASSRPPTAPATDGAEATARFQSARILALQEELDKTIAELASRDGEVQQLRADVKQLSEENRRLQKAQAPAEQSLERLKKQSAGMEAKLKDTEQELGEALKAKDQLELQMRKLEAESCNKEARINRLTEECERYRLSLKESGGQERDRTTADRKEMDRLVGEVRKLERQRTELVSAFKKQMRLIEVLKRQRAHVEAARVLSFTEDEFIRILELSDKLGE